MTGEAGDGARARITQTGHQAPSLWVAQGSQGPAHGSSVRIAGPEGVWKPAPLVYTLWPRLQWAAERPGPTSRRTGERARGSSPKLGEEVPAASHLPVTAPLGSRGASGPVSARPRRGGRGCCWGGWQQARGETQLSCSDDAPGGLPGHSLPRRVPLTEQPLTRPPQPSSRPPRRRQTSLSLSWEMEVTHDA